MKSAVLWLVIATCLAGCASVDEWQRGLAYAPSREIMATPELESLPFTDQWVESPATDGVAAGILHGWWVPNSSSDAPAILYLHGNDGNISSNRNINLIHRLHQAGFAVLAIDYRGYGRSAMALPNEPALYADAQAAWERMLTLSPHARKRLIYGHSLGGAVAIDLALTATHLDALVVEGTYTSFADVVQTTRYGWLPLSLILTQKICIRREDQEYSGSKTFLYMARRMRSFQLRWGSVFMSYPWNPSLYLSFPMAVIGILLSKRAANGSRQCAAWPGLSLDQWFSVSSSRIMFTRRNRGKRFAV